MKTPNLTTHSSLHATIVFLSMFVFFFGNAQVVDSDTTDLDKTENNMQPEIYWHVKAFLPEADFLDIKAIDKHGRRHDVKAIQDSDITNVLSVKAVVDGKQLPIKVITRNHEKYYPVKAIDAKGNLISIKAITATGALLDVKGVSRNGNIINLRAITSNKTHYNIIAISPDSKVNAVKGVKMLDQEIETTLLGIPIFAHVKALQQD